MQSTVPVSRVRITETAGFTARPYIGRTARLIDVSVALGWEDLFEVQLDPPQPYDPSSLWVERGEFELIRENRS